MKGYVRILAIDLKIDGYERMGGREKGLPPPEQYSGATVRHARRQEAHRSDWFGRYGAPFSKPRVPGGSGDEGASTLGKIVAGEHDGCDGRHGRLREARGFSGKWP
jgi:hypothetical protein